MTDQMLFCDYYKDWIALYKCGAVRPVTLQKYTMTLMRLTELAPYLKICELDKRSYQSIINEYAKTREKQTVMDFHRHLRSAILDVVDEGLLTSDPTRKVVIKGKAPTGKKPKFISQFQLRALLQSLNLSDGINWDWLILLIAKTGLRFSEALAITPNDFNFAESKLKITKTWIYKKVGDDIGGNFGETKNISSKRTISIDPHLCKLFSDCFINGTDYPENESIFVDGRVFNSTVNSRLKSLCKMAGIPTITIHSLRHTHASLLIYAGVSLVSVAKRLGHSNVSTTQETYLHIIKELEDLDNDKILSALDGLAV